jgi:predicted nucleic acid-binding protein
MCCVVDSSVVASWFLPDEGGPGLAALAARIGRDGAVAPGIWQLEMANILLAAERKRRMTPVMQRQIIEALDALPISLEAVLNHKQRGEVLELARKHALTASDAAYLELALRLKLPLATLDAGLRRGAKAEGIDLLPQRLPASSHFKAKSDRKAAKSAKKRH